MNIILKKTSHYGIDKIRIDEKSAYEICDKEGIEVYENQDFTAFLTVDGKPVIALKKGLTGLRKLFALLHELGHYFLDCGDELNAIYFLGASNRKAEFQADSFATLAMLPKKELNSYEFLEEHPNPFARQLYEDRKKLEFLYGEKK